MSKEFPYLSLIIPSYNSAAALEKNIPFLLDYLCTKRFLYEVIIVDDGSKDNGRTKAVAAQLGCEYIANEVNLGKGRRCEKRDAACPVGLYRIFTDADVPYETDAIDKILHYLDGKEFHMVVGDRTLPGSVYYSSIKNSRNIGSKIFSFIVGRFITGGWFDTQCGGIRKALGAAVAKDIS